MACGSQRDFGISSKSNELSSILSMTGSMGKRFLIDKIGFPTKKNLINNMNGEVNHQRFSHQNIGMDDRLVHFSLLR